MDEPKEIWLWCLANWHKILVVIIAMIHAWKFFMDYIRPVAHEEETVIKIPKEGVIITIKPIE